MEIKCYCGHTDRCDCEPEIEVITLDLQQRIVFTNYLKNKIWVEINT